jgi:hypothetical protein
MEQVVFGVIDPRTHEIKQVAEVKDPGIDEMRRYFRKFFIDRPATSVTGPYTAWVRDLREAGLEPEFVILEHSARPGGKARWIQRLRDAGAELTNSRSS